MLRRMMAARCCVNLSQPRSKTVVALVLAAILFAFLNRPYERVNLYAPDRGVGSVSFATLSHVPEWPFHPERIDCCGWPFEMRYAETFRDRPARVFWSWSGVAGNLVAGLAILFAQAVFLEIRARRAKRVLQMTLADAAFVSLVCAGALAAFSTSLQGVRRQCAAVESFASHGSVVRLVRGAAWQKPYFEAHDGPTLRQFLSHQEHVVAASVDTDEPPLRAALRACPQVEVLHLSGGEWLDLDFLRSCPRLTSLSISGTFDGESLAVLQHLPRLRRLDVDSPNLDDAGLKLIAKYSSLDRLAAQGSFADDGAAAIAEMQSLRALQLNSPNMSDVGVASIARLADLEELSLQIKAQGATLHD